MSSLQAPNSETSSRNNKHYRVRFAPVIAIFVMLCFSLTSDFLRLKRLDIKRDNVDIVRPTAKNASAETNDQNFTRLDERIGVIVTKRNNSSNDITSASDVIDHTLTVDSSNDEQVHTKPVLTLLVMLSGEFGNNMFKIIHGWGMARIAKQEFGLTARIVFAEQRVRGKVISKAKRTTKNLQNCLASPSYIRTEDFELGNRLLDEGYFHQIDKIPESNFTIRPGVRIGHIKRELRKISSFLSENPKLVERENNNNTIVENGSIVPRLMVPLNAMNLFNVPNEFYDEILKEFIFDENECCGKTLEEPPDHDESVLHLRNFATELIKDDFRRTRGYQELDANRISSEVLGHLKEGDKLALVGRNLKVDAQNNKTEAYGIVSALQAKNLTIRFSPGTDDMEDFCFLKNAKKELIGSSRSTYCVFAAYLGGPSNQLTRLYQFISPEMKGKPHLQTFRSMLGDFTNHELRSRMRFESYFSDNMTLSNSTILSHSYGDTRYWSPQGN